MALLYQRQMTGKTEINTQLALYWIWQDEVHTPLFFTSSGKLGPGMESNLLQDKFAQWGFYWSLSSFSPAMEFQALDTIKKSATML